MEHWGAMKDDMFSIRISSIRVKVIVHTKIMIDGRRLCSELDFLWIKGMENALDGPFSTKSCALDMFLYISVIFTFQHL